MKIQTVTIVETIPNHQTFELEIIGKSYNFDEIKSIYYLKIVYENAAEKYIKFHLLFDDESCFDFIFVTETNKLFFTEGEYWGIIDLKVSKILKYEKADIVIFMYKIKNSIIIDDELLVYSYMKDGQLIQNGCSGAPPYEEIVHEDFIEFIQPTGERYQLKIQ